MPICRKLFILPLLFICFLSIAGCEKNRVHESWVEKPAGAVYDDSTVYARLTASITNDPKLQGVNIELNVKDGAVVLSGVANDEDQVMQIVMHSWRVDGVKSVDNQISLNN